MRIWCDYTSQLILMYTALLNTIDDEIRYSVITLTEKLNYCFNAIIVEVDCDPNHCLPIEQTGFNLAEAFEFGSYLVVVLDNFLTNFIRPKLTPIINTPNNGSKKGSTYG